jgi:hypothetical protein
MTNPRRDRMPIFKQTRKIIPFPKTNQRCSRPDPNSAQERERRCLPNLARIIRFPLVDREEDDLACVEELWPGSPDGFRPAA